MAGKARTPSLEDAKAAFLAEWGALGPSWGVSRTMSQIHALLMIEPEPLTTDDVMAALQVSRGSAHTNIRELCDWGLLRRVKRPGDRKDYYEAEKDVWKVVQAIVRSRKRKEVEPVLDTLERCLDDTRGLRSTEAQAFRTQLVELQRFARLGDKVMAKVERGASSRILSWVTRFLK